MIVAIDPGEKKSGYVIVNNSQLIESGVFLNNRLIERLSIMSEPDILGIEAMSSYGRRVGENVFNTCIWIGRFQQTWYDPESVHLIKRKTVVNNITGNPKSGDSQVRRSLLRLYEPTGGGKIPEVGIRKQPGPLFGISTHAWQALAVALYLEKMLDLKRRDYEARRENV